MNKCCKTMDNAREVKETVRFNITGENQFTHWEYVAS